MNMTKRLAASLAFSALAFFGAQVASAAALDLTDGDRISLSREASNYGGAFGGGEFVASGVSVFNGAGDSFLTFCLEFTEHISLGTNYYVKVNTGAVNGGNSTAATYAGDISGTSTFDPLSNATAWLYTQYRNNTLSGFINNNTSANSLQLAIWNLEGELTGSAAASALSAYNSDTVAQGWVAAATGAGWTDIGNVRVLNLYTDASFTNRAQDQLYLAPIPEPETYALMGLGLGLLGFVARRRKQQAAA